MITQLILAFLLSQSPAPLEVFDGVQANVYIAPLVPKIEPGIAAGYGAEVALTGNDKSGRIYVKTGWACPYGPSRIALVRFVYPQKDIPKVRFFPVNANAASLNAWFVAEGADVDWFEIASNREPLMSNELYVWDYEVVSK